MSRHRWIAAATLVAGLAIFAVPAAAYSPAPTRIVYQNHTGGDYEIRTMNPDGSGITTLTNNTDTDAEPAFSPDAKQIAYVVAPAGAKTGDLWIMNADGSQKVQLTPTSEEYVRTPSWSPDGRTIYFLRSVGAASGTATTWDVDIHSISRDANGVWGAEQVVRSTPGTEAEPVVSPDGTKIAFDYGADPLSTARKIWVSNLDGSNAHRVTTATGTADEINPSWSPDGTQIAFTRTYLYTVNVATGRETKITSSAVGYPDWSTRTNEIAFDTYRNGSWDIGKINLSAKKISTTLLATSPDNDTNVDW